MEFYEKLKKLRKENGMSQEDFADQLGVSRQAVSKWENGQGYPETDKLLLISNLFHVSLDYLLKEELGESAGETNEPGYYASRETIEGYLACKQKGAHQIGLGVAIIIASLTLNFLFEENIGTALFLVGAAVGVAVLIAQAFRPKRYEDVEKLPLLMDPAYLRDFRSQSLIARKRYGTMIAIGVVLCILSFVLQVSMEEVFMITDERMSFFLPLVWAAAVYLFITAGSALDAIKLITNNEEHVKHVREESRYGWIYGALMPLATILFLAIGLTRGVWHPTWLIFPITALVCAAIVQFKQNRT